MKVSLIKNKYTDWGFALNQFYVYLFYNEILMANQIKNVTERLVDGFNDYFNNVESFDGRYVCGQLFIYGKAKAYDIGIPGRYNGGDKVKVNYLLNWFNHKWAEVDTSLMEMLSRAKKFNALADAAMPQLASIKRAITVIEYVQLLNAIIEAQQFIKLNQIQSNEYFSRIEDLNIAEITVYQFADMHLVLANLLESIKVRLEKDYDGEHIYPTATMTFLTSLDYLKCDTYTAIAHEHALTVIKVNNTYNFTTEFVEQAFSEKPINELLEKHIPEALVLGLKNYTLLEKSFKHVDNIIAMMDTFLSQLNTSEL